MSNHKSKYTNIRSIYNIILNFGPQHPAAHGVLRLCLELDGEFVKWADAHIGLLHRGTEKLIETKNYLSSLPYFDRLDYVSMISQEHAFALAIEKLGRFSLKSSTHISRVFWSEITRILNHIMSVTTHALDVGAFTPFLWLFEEREKLFEFYERFSGARMHTAFIVPGGVILEESLDLLSDIVLFCEGFYYRIKNIEDLLLKNRIWKERLLGVGVVNHYLSNRNSFSGVLLRSAGEPWDLRKEAPYELYRAINFKVPVGSIGDCYDRFFLRVSEMRQSLVIITQCVQFFLSITRHHYHYKKFRTSKLYIDNSIEHMIKHFKLNFDGYSIDKGSCFSVLESPKGEFGVYLVGNDSSTPYRCKIKSPGLIHLQGIKDLSMNHLLADVVTIIGTQDVVFGEIDR